MGRVQKKNAKNYLLIIIATSLACILCIATVVGGIHMAFGQDHKKQQDILYQNAQITKPVITQNLLTANINSRPGITLEKVKGIVVHYTANPGTSAKANRDYFESRKNCEDKAEYKVSSHFIIGIAFNVFPKMRLHMRRIHEIRIQFRSSAVILTLPVNLLKKHISL